MASVHVREDTPFSNGDPLIPVGGVRKDTAVAMTDVDGDYHPFLFDAQGRLHVTSGGGGGAVDTELPAPIAAADNLADPTAPQVLAHLLGYDAAGNNWDRLRKAGDGLFVGTGSPITEGLSYGPTGITDKNGSDRPLGVVPYLVRGDGAIERQRNNQEITLLVSAARTATTNSADIVNHNARGIVIILDVTAASGTGGLITRLFNKDPISLNYAQANSSPVAIVAVGTYSYLIYAGAGATNVGHQQLSSGGVGRTFRVQVAHGDATSYTYSLSAHLII